MLCYSHVLGINFWIHYVAWGPQATSFIWVTTSFDPQFSLDFFYIYKNISDMKLDHSLPLKSLSLGTWYEFIWKFCILISLVCTCIFISFGSESSRTTSGNTVFQDHACKVFCSHWDFKRIVIILQLDLLQRPYLSYHRTLWVNNTYFLSLRGIRQKFFYTRLEKLFKIKVFMTDEFNSVVFLSDYINLLIFSLPQLISFDYTQIKNLGNDEAITL